MLSHWHCYRKPANKWFNCVLVLAWPLNIYHYLQLLGGTIKYCCGGDVDDTFKYPSCNINCTTQ